MAGEWRQVSVEDIAAPMRNSLVGGPFGSNLVSRDYVESGVPVIRGQNMGGRWVSGEFVFVSEVKAKSLEANLARPKDIIFTQRGTIGQVSLVPPGCFDRYLISQSQMKLTVDRNIADPMFCFYNFKSDE
jgi:type I restriction enzyme S subunit